MKNKLITITLIISVLAGLVVSFVSFNQPNNQVLAGRVGDTWNKAWSSSDIGSISSIAVDDVDGDGTNEIVVGTLNNVDSSVYVQTHHGYVYVFNALTHELEWQSSDIGYVYHIAVADLIGDGRKEIIALVKYGASATIGYRYGFIYVFDGLTHEQKWKSQDVGSYGDLVIEDLDGDGIKEIIASGDYYFSCTRSGNVYVFDGASFTQKWKSGNIPRALEIVIADADDDGVKEIVIGNSVNYCAYSDSEGGYYYPGNIYVFDGVSFIQEWISGDIGMAYVNSLVVDDVDNDGVKEISAGVRRSASPNVDPSKGYIYVFNGKTHAQEWKSPRINGPVNLKIDDVDKDGTKEIIVKTDVNFRVFDGQTHAFEWQSNNVGRNLDLTADDIDNDGVKEILTRNTSGESGNLLIFNGLTHEEEWRSEDIGVGEGVKSLIVADIDNDGWKEIVAGGGKQQHHGNLYIFTQTNIPSPEKSNVRKPDRILVDISSTSNFPNQIYAVIQYFYSDKAEAGFKLYRKIGENGEWELRFSSSETTSVSASDYTANKVGTTYYYYATAVKDGKESEPSEIKEITLRWPDCFDSDSDKEHKMGINYFAKGTHDGKTDYCLDSEKLVEYFCSVYDTTFNTHYKCPNGCQNGVCLTEEGSYLMTEKEMKLRYIENRLLLIKEKIILIEEEINRLMFSTHNL